ncbi:MAG: siderophore-interacting protein [Pseudomonadota bacterium]
MASQYQLSVVSNELTTPNMRRVVLGGASLSGFPAGQESGYVKVVFPQSGADKPLMRSYTIRHFDADSEQLTLDFAVHDAGGPAITWATSARVGDEIEIRGPGATKLVDPEANWYLLAGDMSALPALSANLERMPANAKGYAVIEVLTEADKQPLRYPPGIDLIWVINPNNSQPNRLLFDQIVALPWLDGTPYPWFAGEFDAMREVRRFFRDEKAIDRRAMYISCYWKIGDTDEGMKQAKRMDPDA